MFHLEWACLVVLYFAYVAQRPLHIVNELLVFLGLLEVQYLFHPDMLCVVEFSRRLASHQEGSECPLPLRERHVMKILASQVGLNLGRVDLNVVVH